MMTTTLLETIDYFSRTFLEKRKDNAKETVLIGPLNSNGLAYKRLEDLVLSQGYARLEDIHEKKSLEDDSFVRYNADGSVDRIFLGDEVTYYERLLDFDVPEDDKNIVAHLRFTSGEEMEGYECLTAKMSDLELDITDGAYRAYVKADYERLLQEFKNTFSSRFTYGREALMKALGVEELENKVKRETEAGKSFCSLLKQFITFSKTSLLQSKNVPKTHP